MLRKFTIREFRGIHELSLPLRPVTLISGRNNVGKSSLLECIWLHQGRHTPIHSQTLNTFRGQVLIPANAHDLWAGMFNGFDQSKSISLTAIDTNETLTELHISLKTGDQPTTEVEVKKGVVATAGTTSEPRLHYHYLDSKGGRFDLEAAIREEAVEYEGLTKAQENNCYYLAPKFITYNEDIALFSKLRDNRQHQKIVDLLGKVKPGLQDVYVSKLGRSAEILKFDMEGSSSPIPAYLMGDGFLRFLSIALRIVENRGGTLLIDEMENGLFYSVQEKLWTWVIGAAREFNVQVIATTHSDECIKSLFRAGKTAGAEDVLYLRLEEDNGKHRAEPFSVEELERSFSFELEVR